jgi:hypothetical protein
MFEKNCLYDLKILLSLNFIFGITKALNYLLISKPLRKSLNPLANIWHPMYCILYIFS